LHHHGVLRTGTKHPNVEEPVEAMDGAGTKDHNNIKEDKVKDHEGKARTSGIHHHNLAVAAREVGHQVMACHRHSLMHLHPHRQQVAKVPRALTRGAGVRVLDRFLHHHPQVEIEVYPHHHQISTGVEHRVMEAGSKALQWHQVKITF